VIEKVVPEFHYCWGIVAQGKPAGHKIMDIHFLTFSLATHFLFYLYFFREFVTVQVQTIEKEY